MTMGNWRMQTSIQLKMKQDSHRSTRRCSGTTKLWVLGPSGHSSPGCPQPPPRTPVQAQTRKNWWCNWISRNPGQWRWQKITMHATKIQFFTDAIISVIFEFPPEINRVELCKSMIFLLSDCAGFGWDGAPHPTPQWEGRECTRNEERTWREPLGPKGFSIPSAWEHWKVLKTV